MTYTRYMPAKTSNDYRFDVLFRNSCIKQRKNLYKAVVFFMFKKTG